ncbi:MAG: phytanoyl-CoA dioxygenase family protein [Planctomycetota bacterium]|nr:phytanoyl-CoA dioxygenase family protein [Planctomycetota bacterium]
MSASPSNRVDGLRVDILTPDQVDKAAAIFHRDGFVCVSGLLTPEQLAFAQKGAQRVIEEQTAADPERKGNRGHHRYSYGAQHHNPEWAMLLDLPGLFPIIEKIWGSSGFITTGAGGDYSLPTAEIQPLHADMGDFFNDPTGQVKFNDVPAPFIVTNFMMVDFTRENGAIRFIPCTQRSRYPVPSLADEPQWMRDSILCAPAGTAVIRDVRCWHGGTANNSKIVRPMTSVGFFAPWYRVAGYAEAIPRALYEKLSPRAKAAWGGGIK